MWRGWIYPAQPNYWPKPVTQLSHARIKFYTCMEQCKGN
jgi:hypothetical protein